MHEVTVTGLLRKVTICTSVNRVATNCFEFVLNKLRTFAKYVHPLSMTKVGNHWAQDRILADPGAISKAQNSELKIDLCIVPLVGQQLCGRLLMAT